VVVANSQVRSVLIKTRTELCRPPPAPPAARELRVPVETMGSPKRWNRKEISVSSDDDRSH
jgi:hypothetical protein